MSSVATIGWLRSTEEVIVRYALAGVRTTVVVVGELTFTVTESVAELTLFVQVR